MSWCNKQIYHHKISVYPKYLIKRHVQLAFCALDKNLKLCLISSIACFILLHRWPCNFKEAPIWNVECLHQDREYASCTINFHLEIPRKSCLRDWESMKHGGKYADISIGNLADWKELLRKRTHQLFWVRFC